jgi:hypothetical protein
MPAGYYRQGRTSFAAQVRTFGQARATGMTWAERALLTLQLSPRTLPEQITPT